MFAGRKAFASFGAEYATGLARTTFRFASILSGTHAVTLATFCGSIFLRHSFSKAMRSHYQKRRSRQHGTQLSRRRNLYSWTQISHGSLLATDWLKNNRLVTGLTHAQNRESLPLKLYHHSLLWCFLYALNVYGLTLKRTTSKTPLCLK